MTSPEGPKRLEGLGAAAGQAGAKAPRRIHWPPEESVRLEWKSTTNIITLPNKSHCLLKLSTVSSNRVIYFY
ncbi:hypothetical protein D1B31_17380 [Neobacillus notoginsengisoli]|uniref:Uncharacterized protein n=1 Tax=Neobacillus notoginsengisoli TaxID=1578198 RepID=A0A417YQG1_9BACI|nr:hypothetical protein D1B31_17380 [Neobacillus notoginsengisoli]